MLHHRSSEGNYYWSHSSPPHAVCRGQPRIPVPAGLPHGSTVPAPDGQTNTLWLPHTPRRQGSDVYLHGFFCVEDSRVRDYRANHITIKISTCQKDFQIPIIIDVTKEAGKHFLYPWLSLFIQLISVDYLLGQRDAVANKTVPTLKEVTI